MGLDITFYKQSKLDPRYKEEVGYFRKVNCILTYFGIGENDNCEYVVITKEKFEQFRDDLKKELGSHKGTHLPTEWNDPTCIEPSLYRFSLKVIKSVEWDKDNLEVCCWW